MNLYLLRHGEAGPHMVTGDDSTRPLTPDGIARMARQARTMQRWGLTFDVILSSPYTRAQQTAEAVAAACGTSLQIDARLQSMAFTYKTLAAIIADHQSVANLLLVGHEPDFSTVVSALIGGGAVNIAKGSLACVKISEFKPLYGVLRFLIDPDLMLD